MKKILILISACFTLHFCSLAQTDSMNSVRLNALEKQIEEINRANEINTARNESLPVLADLIISWSGIIFTIFSVLVVGAGIYTGIQITEIRKMRIELDKILGEAKNSFSKQSADIEKLKISFDDEQKKSMKLLFPLIEGQFNFYQGDYDKALSAFLEAQKIDPDHPIIVRHLYRILSNLGRPQEAIQQLEYLLEKNPKDKAIKYRLAQSYRRNNQLDYAEKIVREAAEVDKFPPAIYEYGTIQLFKGNFEEAESNLLEANKLFLKEEGVYKYWVFINLSIAQLRLKKIAESKTNAAKAIEITTKLLKTAPKNPQYLANYALAKFISKEDLDDAINSLETSLSLSLPVEIARSGMEKLEILNIEFKEPKISEIIKTLVGYIKTRKTE